MQPTQQAGDTPGHMDLPDLINKNGSIVDELDPAGMADVYQAMMEGGQPRKAIPLARQIGVRTQPYTGLPHNMTVDLPA